MQGLNIVLISRTASKLEKVEGELREKYSVSTSTLAVDFTKFDDAAQKRVSDLLEELEVGVLVNNVGMSFPRPYMFTEASLDMINRLVEININSTTRMTHIVLPGMVSRRRGTIVNVSSAAGTVPHPLQSMFVTAWRVVCGPVAVLTSSDLTSWLWLCPVALGCWLGLVQLRWLQGVHQQLQRVAGPGVPQQGHPRVRAGPHVCCEQAVQDPSPVHVRAHRQGLRPCRRRQDQQRPDLGVAVLGAPHPVLHLRVDPPLGSAARGAQHAHQRPQARHPQGCTPAAKGGREQGVVSCSDTLSYLFSPNVVVRVAWACQRAVGTCAGLRVLRLGDTRAAPVTSSIE